MGNNVGKKGIMVAIFITLLLWLCTLIASVSINDDYMKSYLINISSSFLVSLIIFITLTLGLEYIEGKKRAGYQKLIDDEISNVIKKFWDAYFMRILKGDNTKLQQMNKGENIWEMAIREFPSIDAELKEKLRDLYGIDLNNMINELTQKHVQFSEVLSYKDKEKILSTITRVSGYAKICRAPFFQFHKNQINDIMSGLSDLYYHFHHRAHPPKKKDILSKKK